MKIEQWEIEKLIPYARNPRRNDQAVDRVASAIKEFGFRVPIIAKSDGSVVDGHLRLKAAQKLGLDLVPVVLADDMTETQIKAFRISVNRMAELAEWDHELLALEIEDLRLDDFDIDLTGFDADELGALVAGDGGEKDNNYSRKIESPVYEITGDCPKVVDLFNRKKADSLIAEIDRANLPDDVADFLRYAAERHVIFDFRNIAEFYAHASADVQDLMEQSALVIIDFNRAIADGFVRLTDEIAAQYSEDNQNA